MLKLIAMLIKFINNFFRVEGVQQRPLQSNNVPNVKEVIKPTIIYPKTEVVNKYTQRKEALLRRKKEFDVWKSNCEEVHQVLMRLRTY